MCFILVRCGGIWLPAFGSDQQRAARPRGGGGCNPASAFGFSLSILPNDCDCAAAITGPTFPRGVLAPVLQPYCTSVYYSGVKAFLDTLRGRACGASIERPILPSDLSHCRALQGRAVPVRLDEWHGNNPGHKKERKRSIEVSQVEHTRDHQPRELNTLHRLGESIGNR